MNGPSSKRFLEIDLPRIKETLTAIQDNDLNAFSSNELITSSASTEVDLTSSPDIDSDKAVVINQC